MTDLRIHLFTEKQCRGSRNTSMVRRLETLCGRSLSYTRNIGPIFIAIKITIIVITVIIMIRLILTITVIANIYDVITTV